MISLEFIFRDVAFRVRADVDIYLDGRSVVQRIEDVTVDDARWCDTGRAVGPELVERLTDDPMFQVTALQQLPKVRGGIPCSQETISSRASTPRSSDNGS